MRLILLAVLLISFSNASPSSKEAAQQELNNLISDIERMGHRYGSMYRNSRNGRLDYQKRDALMRSLDVLPSGDRSRTLSAERRSDSRKK